MARDVGNLLIYGMDVFAWKIDDPVTGDARQVDVRFGVGVVMNGIITSASQSVDGPQLY